LLQATRNSAERSQCQSVPEMRAHMSQSDRRERSRFNLVIGH
jgi:hypothetical protein